MRLSLAVCILSLSGCATLKQPFLYSAQKIDQKNDQQGERKILILGTIHRGVLANDLPSAVTDAMNGAQVAYFETDFRLYQKALDARDDKEAQRELNRKLFFRRRRGDPEHPSEPRLSRRLSVVDWAEFRHRFERRIPVSVLDELNPDGALSLLEEGHGEEVTGFEAYRMSSANGMDFNLFSWARDRGLRTERLDDDDFACQRERDSENLRKVQKYIESGPESGGLAQFRDLVEAYRDGDAERVRALNAPIEEGPEGACLLGWRNRNWSAKLAASLATYRKIFVAVGAMHLLTTKYPSLLQLLEEQGYVVKRVVP